MVSTLLLIALIVGVLILQVFLRALFLWFGMRWAKVADVTMLRVLVVTACVFTTQYALGFVALLSRSTSDGLFLLFGLLQLAAMVLVPCLVIRQVFKAGLLRALQAWLPTMLPMLAMIPFAFLVLRPFLCEAFVSPTNAMAPTLLGRTWRSTCPECGQINYCSPRDQRYAVRDPLTMICDNFHVADVADFEQRTYAPDRFLAMKFLAPRRWDIIVFQYPADPSTMYVKRLVGLSGETVHIEEGAVWINGSRIEPPDHLRGIHYLSEIPGLDADLSGTKNHPAVLGEDEYFVLGDFSAQSADSRLWQYGAAGHNRFAVPQSHLRGVVTHIYWPPERWRALR